MFLTDLIQGGAVQDFSTTSVSSSRYWAVRGCSCDELLSLHWCQPLAGFAVTGRTNIFQVRRESTKSSHTRKGTHIAERRLHCGATRRALRYALATSPSTLDVRITPAGGRSPPRRIAIYGAPNWDAYCSRRNNSRLYTRSVQNTCLCRLSEDVYLSSKDNRHRADHLKKTAVNFLNI